MWTMFHVEHRNVAYRILIDILSSHRMTAEVLGGNKLYKESAQILQMPSSSLMSKSTPWSLIITQSPHITLL